MSQHDYSLDNQAGAALRTDLNNALLAIVSGNSGAAEPATMFAYQEWNDTTAGLKKIRNGANTAWITIGKLGSIGLDLGFAVGTRMPFNQTNAPTGWTKDVSVQNESAMRIVTGAAGSGGSVAFSTAFASQAVAGTNSAVAPGTTDGHTLTVAEMPAHAHTQRHYTLGSGPTNGIGIGGSTAEADAIHATTSAGSGNAHTHTFTATHTHTFSGTAINLAVKYHDFIIASKD